MAGEEPVVKHNHKLPAQMVSTPQTRCKCNPVVALAIKVSVNLKILVVLAIAIKANLNLKILVAMVVAIKASVNLKIIDEL